MGLFDFLKKEPLPKGEIPGSESQETKPSQNFQKDEAGLYPYEILMLSYLEKYADGKEPARFWEREYCVDDVCALIKSLEDRGFAKDGRLTKLGQSEIANNEYVLYMHRHKFNDISMSRMSVLVHQNPNINYRDLLWGEFNRLSLEYMKNRQFGWYRNIKFAMYKFLLEEKKYGNAFPILAEVFFYDLNGSESPFIAPALIEEAKTIEQRVDYTYEKIVQILQKLFDKMYAPYRNYSNDDVIYIVASYCFGDSQKAESVFNKKAR